MEEFGFDKVPSVLRLMAERLERIEILLQQLSAPEHPAEQFMSVKEAADFLNLTVQAVYSMVSRKQIPFNKPGKRLYFEKEELEKWIRAGKVITIEPKSVKSEYLRPAKRRTL